MLPSSNGTNRRSEKVKMGGGGGGWNWGRPSRVSNESDSSKLLHSSAMRAKSEQSVQMQMQESNKQPSISILSGRLANLRHVDSINDSKTSLSGNSSATKSPPSTQVSSQSPPPPPIVTVTAHNQPAEAASRPTTMSAGGVGAGAGAGGRNQYQLYLMGAQKPPEYPQFQIDRVTDADCDRAVPQLIVTGPRAGVTDSASRNRSYPPFTADNMTGHASTNAGNFDYYDAARSAGYGVGVGVDTIAEKRQLPCVSMATEDTLKVDNCMLQAQAQSQTPTDNSARQTSSRHLKEQIVSFFQPSDNKLAMKLFGNRNALMKEKLRQQQSGFRFIIHPCSSFRFYWDLIMLICLNVNVIVLPVIIAYFNDDLDSHWLIFNSISDALFIVDIVTNFRTGVITNDYAEQIVLNPRHIALHYIRTWFFLDVISTIPMDYLFLLVHNDADDQVRTAHLMHAGRALRILRLAKLLSLLRLLRFSRVVRYVTQWEEFLNIAKMVIRVFNLVLLILLLAHWQACLQFLIPSLNDFPADCWVTIEELVDAPWISQYTWSVFRAMSHMLSIGYGRIPPQSTSDAWMTMGSMLTGAICYAMFVGHASALIQSFDTSRRLYREKWKQVEEYMAFRKFPRSLRERISSYYEHRYQGKMFNEDAILCELSECLKQQIVNYNCRALVAAVPFFSNADPDFVTQVVTKLRFEVYQPGDVVIKEGTLGTKMYFIQEGIVDIITKDGEVATSLSDGSYFGEICLLTNARRVASVRTVTYCNLYSLSKDHFNEVLDEYPLMRRTMEMIAAERLHKIGETTQQLAISRSQTDLDADAFVVKEIVSRVLEDDQLSANARSLEEDIGELPESSTGSMSPQSPVDPALLPTGSRKRSQKKHHKLKLSIPLLVRSRRGSQASLSKSKHEKCISPK